MLKIILALSLFLLSLMSHGYIPYIIGSFLLSVYIFFRAGFILSFKEIFYLIAAVIFINLSALLFNLDLFSTASAVSVNSFYNNYAYFYFVVFVSFLFYRLLFSYNPTKNFSYFTLPKKNNFVKNDVQFAVGFAFICHIFIFYLQFVIVYMTGYYIDFLQLTYGVESRYINYFLHSSNLGWMQFRVTGFYLEPSTYVAAMSCLLLLAFLFGLNGYLITIGVLSLFLSFSTVGILFSSVIFLSFLLTRFKVFYVFVFVFVVSFIFLFFHDFFNLFYLDFINKIFATIEPRIVILEGFIFHPAFGLNLFGYNIFNISESSINYALNSFGAVNDSGLLAFLIMKIGIVPILIVLLIIFKVNRGLLPVALLFVILLSKISYVNPIFIFSFMAFFMLQYRKVRDL